MKESPDYTAVAVILDQKARRLDEQALKLIENKYGFEEARVARIQANVLRETAQEFRDLEAGCQESENKPTNTGETK